MASGWCFCHSSRAARSISIISHFVFHNLEKWTQFTGTLVHYLDEKSSLVPCFIFTQHTWNNRNKTFDVSARKLTEEKAALSSLSQSSESSYGKLFTAQPRRPAALWVQFSAVHCIQFAGTQLIILSYRFFLSYLAMKVPWWIFNVSKVSCNKRISSLFQQLHFCCEKHGFFLLRKFWGLPPHPWFFMRFLVVWFIPLEGGVLLNELGRKKFAKIPSKEVI